MDLIRICRRPSARNAVASEISACRWLPDDELAVYVSEYERNGFQAGYNVSLLYDDKIAADCNSLPDVRSMCRRVSLREKRLGNLSESRAFERMQRCLLNADVGLSFARWGGHWCQQEQPKSPGIAFCRSAS